MIIIREGANITKTTYCNVIRTAEMDRYSLCIFAFVLPKCVDAEFYFNQLNGPRPTIPIDIQSMIHPILYPLIIRTFCY